MHASNSEHECTTFKPGNSTTTLRAHLSRFHLDEWVEYCDKRSIPMKWKDTEVAVNSYHQKHGQKLESLKPTEHKKFSNKAFVDALAAFNVLESEQLQGIFMMLCEDLKKSDIPSKTTMQTHIHELLNNHLALLEKALQVCSFS